MDFQLTSAKELKAKTLEELFARLESLPSVTISQGFDLYDKVQNERDRITSAILKRRGGYEAYQAHVLASHAK